MLLMISEKCHDVGSIFLVWGLYVWNEQATESEDETGDPPTELLKKGFWIKNFFCKPLM